MSRAVPPGAGTANITKTFIAASHDKKSLPTQVHVRPSNINCNSLRADFSLTKFNPSVLIGAGALSPPKCNLIYTRNVGGRHDLALRVGSNWDEQRTFDKVNTVDPAIKAKGLHYNHVESVQHDMKCPPTMGGVEPRYTTESRFMSKWLPPPDESLPDVNVCCDTIGKPLYADVDPNLYMTTASYIGTASKVRFH